MAQKVRVKFESGFVDPRKGKGWAALLKPDQSRQIVREFLPTNRIYGKGGYTFSLDTELPVGSILEISAGGSWKNLYRGFYVVEPTGELSRLGDWDSIKAKKAIFELLGVDRFAPPPK